MLNSPRVLPRRVARPVSAAFSVGDGRTAPEPSAPPVEEFAPHNRANFSLKTDRVDLPPSVTDFWPLAPDVLRFEMALTALAAASVAAGTAGFDADSRATLHRCWADLREAAAQGTFVPRARVGAIGVAMACESAMQALVAWNEADAPRQAFELTGGMLAGVLHQCRTVLVESAAQAPLISALMMRVVKHLHPLPSERPTAASLAELEQALAELSRVHPDATARAAFGRCHEDLTA